MERVNIMIGRFQPFTKGHYSCIRAAKNIKNLPTVICMINVSPTKVDKRHPFPSEMLSDLYSELFKNNEDIAEVVSIKSADIVYIANMLRSYGYEIASWTCGSDRFDEYSRMARKYHELAGLSSDFEVIEVKRTDDDISATKARMCLLNDDREGFLSMIPDGSYRNELYDILKRQIDRVYKFESLDRRLRFLERYFL